MPFLMDHCWVIIIIICICLSNAFTLFLHYFACTLAHVVHEEKQMSAFKGPQRMNCK